jgi:NADPH:quinone reductase-like Zn-dependent oxidoreductase
MKAAVIREYGGPGVLHLEDVAEPTVGPTQILIRVAAASINPMDTFEHAGQTKDWRLLAFPAILEWDVAGKVVSAGADAKGFAPGDEVFSWGYHTYAELCSVDAAVVAKIPARIDLQSAAALPLVWTTGSQLISVASGMTAGQTVLVALPPVDVVANTVRGATADRLLGKLKPGGTFASVTGAPSSAKEYPSVRVVAFVSKQSSDTLRYIGEAAWSRRLSIPIGERLPLKDAAKGHALVEAGGAAGKVLLLP